jgi:hypothetical protein
MRREQEHMIVDRDCAGPKFGDKPGPYETVRVVEKAARGRAMRPPQARKSDNLVSRSTQQQLREVDSVRFRRDQARS